VKSTVHAGCFYPARPIWEDIEFLHLLDESGLAVCKTSKYVHMKAHFRAVKPLPPPPPPPQRLTLERFLDESRHVYQGPEHENGCLWFLGEYGYKWQDADEETGNQWFDAFQGDFKSYSTIGSSALLIPLQVPKLLMNTKRDIEELFGFVQQWAEVSASQGGQSFESVTFLVRFDPSLLDEASTDNVLDDDASLLVNVKGLTPKWVKRDGGSLGYTDAKGTYHEFIYHEGEEFRVLTKKLPSAGSGQKRPAANAFEGGSKRPRET